MRHQRGLGGGFVVQIVSHGSFVEKSVAPTPPCRQWYPGGQPTRRFPLLMIERLTLSVTLC